MNASQADLAIGPLYHGGVVVLFIAGFGGLR